MKIFAVGDVVMDLHLEAERFPGRGEDSEILERAFMPGGSSLNFAVASSRLEIPTTLAGKIGNDKTGEELFEFLEDEEYLISNLVVEENKSTGMGVVVTDSGGKRTLFSYRGAYPNLQFEELDMDALLNADILHVTGYAFIHEPLRTTTQKVIEKADKEGIQIALDPCYYFAHADISEIEEVLKKVDIFAPNLKEAQEITGVEETWNILNSLEDLGPKLVALKLGRQGSIVSNEAKTVKADVIPFDTIDTTGAGDAFLAAFLAGKFQFNFNLLETAIFANGAGAKATTRKGGSISMPTLKEIHSCLNEKKEDIEESIDSLLFKLREETN